MSSLLPNKSHAELVAWFLEAACPDHHIRGGYAHAMRGIRRCALKRFPEISRDSIHTDVVCGDLENKEGQTAADRAERLAMFDVAALPRSKEGIST